MNRKHMFLLFSICISGILLFTNPAQYAVLILVVLCIYIATTNSGDWFLQKKEELVITQEVLQENSLPELFEQRKTYFFMTSMLHRLKEGLIFLATDENDEEQYLNIKNMYHLLISGRTGNGKTTLLKQLLLQMVQLCDCYFIHPMFAEVGGVEDERIIEVWTPIAERLKIHPSKFKGNYALINTLLLRFELLLDHRAKEKGTTNELTWKKQYLFIDEGPLVVARCSDAKRVIGRIVREGRQLHVFLCLSTQGAQVQTLGISTADLSQFGTKFYLGGCDSRTRREIMPELSAESEKTFTQKGMLYYTAPEQTEPKQIRLPLLTNETLFECFGLTFEKQNYSEWFTKKK